MAKKKRTYVSLVDKKIGANEDGSPKLVLKVGEIVEGLTAKQVTNYKQQNFIK